MHLSKDELIKLVLSSFLAEKRRDLASNKKLISDDFTVTDMIYKDNGTHMKAVSGSELDKFMQIAFKIEGREYEFKNIVADEESQTVMVEFIESYPDPETGQMYVTPQVAVCDIRDGLIHRTRHYLDPRLSRAEGTANALKRVFNK